MSPSVAEPEVTDPALGMPMETMRKLASADWHAGHRDLPCSLGTAIPCGCATREVLGDFAVRLLSGQAQGSTAPGIDGYMAAYFLDETRPATPERPVVLARLTVLGQVQQDEQCTNPDCEREGEHGSLAILGVRTVVDGHRAVDSTTALELLGNAMAEYAMRTLFEQGGEERG